MPAGRKLSFIGRGCWGDHGGGRGVSSWFPCTLLLLVPVVLGWHVRHPVELTPATFSGTLAGSFMVSLAGAPAVLGSGTAPAMDAPAGFPMSPVAPPVCGTLVASWGVQPVPLPASYKFSSTPKGSFLVNFMSTPVGSFLPTTLPCWPPWCFHLASSDPQLLAVVLACFTDHLWPRAT